MNEAGPTITVTNTGVEVAKATGVSESSVRRVISETKNIESVSCTSFSTPHKERPRKSPRRCQYVRNIEQQLMAREGQHYKIQ
jgi:antitoxin (DNA-binding transcriptional repressor) of toxin-antitoxin stability system